MPKYKTENPIFKLKRNLYKINCGKNKPIYTHQMKKIIEQVENMLTWHHRVLIVVFDLHVDAFSLTNKKMSALVEKARHYLNKNYAIKRFGYCWCREQNISDKQHYHVAVMLNGSNIRHPQKLLKSLIKIWKDIVPEGMLYTPNNCYYTAKRNNDLEKLKAIYRLSYQAKVWTKDKNGAHARDYATSQIKAKVV